MLNIVLGGFFTVFFFAVYLVMLVFIYWLYPRFIRFRYEIFGIVTNGLIGIVGFNLYSFNVPITGKVLDTMIIVPASCTDPTCEHMRTKIVIYATISTARFVCYFLESLVSFVFIAVFLAYPYTMSFSRYSVHSINTCLSIVTLVMTSNVQFPIDYIYGSRVVAPVVVQAVLLLYSIMSFWFIVQSSLYQQACRFASVRITW